MFFGHFYPPPPLPPSSANGTRGALDLLVPVEDYQSLDLDTFYRRYGYPRQPVMLRNSGVETWPAWEQWTLDALAAKVRLNLIRVQTDYGSNKHC